MKAKLFVAMYVMASALTVLPDRLMASCDLLINTVEELQNINQNLSGKYCLNRDIDASITATWNGGAGFIQIGDWPFPFTQPPIAFTGTFDGQGHVIDKLTINSSVHGG